MEEPDTNVSINISKEPVSEIPISESTPSKAFIISRWMFLILAFLLPIWVLPTTVLPLDINKAYLAYTLITIAGLCWLASYLQRGVIKVPKSLVLLFLGVIIIIWLAASLFSQNSKLSFIGAGYELDTFAAITFLGVAAFLLAMLFQERKYILQFIAFLFAGATLSFIFQLFHSGFGITLLPWKIFPTKTSNLIGAWNEVAIFFGFIGLLALILFETLNFKPLKKPLLGLVIVALLAMAMVNFSTAWTVLGIFVIVFLVYGFSVLRTLQVKKDKTDLTYNHRVMWLPLIVLFIVLFFIFGRLLVGDLITSLGLATVEVRPSWNSTIDVVKQTLSQGVSSLLLGSGPNTFLYDWLRFKPASINATMFWNTRFSVGVGLLPSLTATAGILGGIAWLGFLIFLLMHGFKALMYSGDDRTRGLLLALALGAVYLWTFAIFYAPSFLLFSLAFMFTGLLIGLLVKAGKLETIEFNFFKNPSIGFVSTLIIVLLMIGGVSGLYLLSQKYIAAYAFAKGLQYFNVAGNIDKAEASFIRATRLDPQDRYYRALTETNLIRLQQLLAQTDLSTQAFTGRFQNILGATINNAQFATSLNRLDPLNWMNLGKVYEAIVPFGVNGADNLALSAYNQALQVSPFDPRPLLASARVAIQINDVNKAKEYLQQAIDVKNDYTAAHFLLAQLEAQQGNLREAIRRTEQTAFLAPNDIGVLFQLGLLYYQDNQLDKGRIALERAVQLNPNYSNARYFLGLIYDQQGRKSDAIAQFEKIEALNPDNAEVKKILRNLREGRRALAEISPPQPAPEERQEPPIEEEEQSSLED